MGSIKEMRSTCVECGHQTTAGRVAPWIEMDEGVAMPKESVSYRCSGCGETVRHTVEVTTRWGEE